MGIAENSLGSTKGKRNPPQFRWLEAMGECRSCMSLAGYGRGNQKELGPDQLPAALVIETDFLHVQ